jgi:hypothetical protein
MHEARSGGPFGIAADLNLNLFQADLPKRQTPPTDSPDARA